MSRSLQFTVVFILAGLFICFMTPSNVLAQCNGADGTGIYFGSVANSQNGTICANNPVLPAVMEIDIRNVMEGAGQVRFVIDWQDGSTETVNASKIAANRFGATVNHLFPPNGANVRCEYRPTVRIQYGTNPPCAASLGEPPRFVRWNTDDQNTGQLRLSETATNRVVYEVCAGVETNVTFTDRSTLNCVPPALTLGQNDRMRWRQFVYGTTNTITGQVRIGGAIVGFPNNGPVYTSPEPIENSGFPTTTTQVITVPASAQVGERFVLRMNYWNTCNSYTGGRPPVETYAEILIVAQPAPPTGSTQTVCSGTTPNNFTITGVPGGNIVNWYRNVPGSPDAPGTLITSGTSTTLNIGATGTGYTNNTTPGVYKVWASYRPNVANALNCESPRIAVTRTIKNAIPVPNPSTAPPANICNGSSFTIAFPGPATETFGGATQYNFGTAAGVTVGSSNANSATYNVNVTFTPGQLFVDRTITVGRRYSGGAGPDCATTRDFTIRVYNQPVGGTLSDFPNVCQGASIGPITLSGRTGNIVRWEMQTNAGPWVTYAGPSSGNTITPGVLAANTYRFRAVVGNAPCTPEVYSTVDEVIVSASIGVVTAGPDQALCNQLTANLNATLPAGTGQWTYIGSVPAGRPTPTFSSATSQTSTVTIANPAASGAYTLRWTVTAGSCSVFDDVVIDFGSAPDPIDPIDNVDHCGESFTLGMPAPSIGTGVWTVESGPGACSGAGCPIVIDDINSPTSDIELAGPAFTYGTYVLRWTVTSGVCPVETNIQTVTFFRPVTVAASDITTAQCLASTGGTAISLTGTIGGGAAFGTWIVTVGDGTIGASSAGTTVTATYTSTAVDYVNGTTLRATLIASPPALSACPAVSETIDIAVDRRPVAVAISPLSTCDDAIQLQAESPIPYGATGMWTGPGGIIFDDPTDPHTFARNLPAAPSTRTLTWTLTSAGGTCTNAVTVDVNRVTLPAATNVDLLLCEAPPAGGPLTTSITLIDHESAVTTIPAAQRTIQWYQNGPPPLGIPVADPTVVLTNISDGAVFVARIQETATLCTSDAFVTVNVRPLPTANTANVAICESSMGSNQALGIDLYNDFTYRDAITNTTNQVTWFSDMAGAVANDPASIIPNTPFDITGGRQVFARVTYSSLPSCPNIATLNLSVKPIPNINAIIGRSQVCLGDPTTDPDELPVETYQVTAVTGARYYWTIPTGPDKFKHFGGGGLNDFFALLQFPNITNPTPESISVRVELNGCSSGTVTLPITVNDQPIKPIIAGDDVVCENQDGVMYQVVSPNAGSNYTWEIKRVSDGTDGGAFIQVGQGLSQIFVQYTNEPVYFVVKEVAPSLCVSDTAQYWVDVNRRPRMLASPTTVCSDSPTNILFAEHPLSPVGIDRYDINSFNKHTNLTWVNPTTPPTFPWVNAPADAIQDHAFENLFAVPYTARYNVTPISTEDGLECPGSPVDLTITVNPEPQLHPSLGKAICSGEETGIMLLSAPNTFPADRFLLDDIVYPAGVTPVGVLPAADGTTTATLYTDAVIANTAWINTTGLNQIVQYFVRPVSTVLGCTGNPPTAITVTVYPQSDVVQVPDPELCNGDPLNVTFTSSNNSDADFGWIVTSYSSNILLGTMAGTGNISNMIITNTSSSVDGTVTFEVRAINPTVEGGDDCQNPPMTFTVTIKNSPVAIALNLHGCSELPNGNTFRTNLSTLETSINPNAGTPSISIVWYDADPRIGPANVIPGASLTNYQMTDGVPVYAEVENVLTTCKRVVPVRFEVTPGVFITPTAPVHNGYNLFCNSDNSGQIDINVYSGTAGYSYSLNGGPFINAGLPNYSFLSLAAVNHSIEVRDSKGCRVTETVLLNEPDPLDVILAPHELISCFMALDGAVATTVTGGTGSPYGYLLLQTNTTDPNQDGIFTGLGHGSYTVRVTDSNNCTVDSNTIPLNQPAAVVINGVSVLTDANGFNLTCRDKEDGQIAVTFSGGNNPPPDYTLTLTKATDPANPIIANANGLSHTFENLGFGNYTVVVRDVKGCPSLPAAATIVNPPPFSPGFIGMNQSICKDEDPEAMIEMVPAFGGVGNYQYQWQYSVTGSMNPLDWLNITGETGVTYDPGVLTDATDIYYRRLVSSGTCGQLGHDNIVKVTVNPLPLVDFYVLNNEVCANDPFSLYVSLVPGTGTGPIEYDYQVGLGTVFLGMIGSENTQIPVAGLPESQDYTLLRVKDFNGCLATNVPQTQSISVVKAVSDFTVLAPAEQCSGGTYTFQWNVESGVEYKWVWSDGRLNDIPADSLPAGMQTITHIFRANNPVASTQYPVSLQASRNLCKSSTIKPITVLPSVRLNIIPGDTILCSGESIRFIDQSEGVDIGRWYYRIVGSGEEHDVRPGPVAEVSYQMFNTTTTNPIYYEVVYEASNTEGCGDTYSQELKVYRGITAGILNTPDPPNPFIGGISTVQFTNNSAPLDDGAFEYTWDFDDARATPPTGSGINPITVDYFRAGIKTVKLTAVNILSRDENNTCSSTAIKSINIMLPEVGAAFRATPLASCFPVNVTVENLSPGADTFLWELYDQTGLVGTSNLREPVFRILTPGVYDIYLTASYYSTGQTATISQRGIEVFDVPTALFEMRPNPLYVPDTELQTFNKSARATEYHWDFDDGSTSTEFEPRHFYKLEGKYFVTLVAGHDYGQRDVDGDGIMDGRIVCYDTVRNELVALDGGYVKLPNAFTPSVNGSTGGVAGNGTFNDVFLPIARGVEEFQMQIFDRWGNMVFETQDRNVGWDGYDRNHRLMPAGVYVYKLIMRLSNGQRTTKIGDVTLIR